MSDHHDDEPKEAHERPVDPFPTAFPPPPVSLFPPVLVADPPSDWNAGADAHDLPTAEPPTAADHPLAALGRFAFPPGPPLDDDGLGARDRRWTSRIIVIATLFLLVFNAVSIQNWSRQQAPGWVTSTVQQLSDVWSAQIAQLGADQPRQGVREAYQAAQAQQFPGQAPGAGPSEAAR